MQIRLFIFSIVIILLSLSSRAQQPADTLGFDNNNQQPGDTIQYELLIFDPHFESWYNQVRQPLSFYSIEYLENWNQQLVSQWNTQVPSPRRAACITDSFIHYESGISYGLELNHKLFYFFRYIHERCRVFFNVPGRW